MTTLAANKDRTFEMVGYEAFQDLPVIAADTEYAGAAIGSSAGLMRPLVGGDRFEGFAERKTDNEAGAASATSVQLRTKGHVKLSVTGVSSAAQLGKNVYATDDDTFTLTATGGSLIGKVVRWITSTWCIVAFEAFSERGPSGDVASVSLASSSTVTNTIAETAFDVTAAINGADLEVGDVIEVTAGVTTPSTNSTDTLTLKAKVGSTVIATSPVVDVANDDAGRFKLELTVRAIGASGSLVASGEVGLGPLTATMRPTRMAATTVDTTGTLTFSVTATWSVASASNQAVLEILNVHVRKRAK